MPHWENDQNLTAKGIRYSRRICDHELNLFQFLEENNLTDKLRKIRKC